MASRDPPQTLDRTFDNTQEYAKTVRDIAQEEEVAVLDVWTKMWDAAGHVEGNLCQFLYDGLHPNKAGYDVRFQKRVITLLSSFLLVDRVPGAHRVNPREIR